MSDRSGGIQLLIRRAFKFELKPNGMQIQLMKQFCGCARYVYNRTLSLEKSLYKKDSKHSFMAVGLVATTYRIIEHFLDGTPLEPVRRSAIRGSRIVLLSYASLVMMVLLWLAAFCRFCSAMNMVLSGGSIR